METSPQPFSEGGRELWCEAQQQQREQTELLDLDLKHIKKEADSLLQKEQSLRTASKPHSTPLTLKWLEETYELAEGVCIPRSTLYLHYLDFCSHQDSQPVNAASFGKIIRQQFPQLTTRRLGTRGQSKYHYYGIGIKETSPYYDVMYSKNGVQSCGEGRRDSPRGPMLAYSPRAKLGTLLPPFPDVNNLTLPEDVDPGKVSTFLTMYRAHCQRVLDTVVRASFDELEGLLVHFWHSLPPHVLPALQSPCLVRLVGACDCVLYKTLAAVLTPSVLQPVTDSLAQVMRRVARQLDDWLRSALRGLPDALVSIKLDLSRRFAQALRRQSALGQLCQAARAVTSSRDIVTQMLEDWGRLDITSICKQTLYAVDHYSHPDLETLTALHKEFVALLEEQSPLEAYTDWMDSLLHRCVLRGATHAAGGVRGQARQFLLMWTCFGSRVMRDMTLHSAPSFGSFHLLHLLFDEYTLYMVESLHLEERAAELLSALSNTDGAESRSCSLALSRLAGQTSAHTHTYPANTRYAMQGYSYVDGGGSVSLGDCDVNNHDVSSHDVTSSTGDQLASEQPTSLYNTIIYPGDTYYQQTYPDSHEAYSASYSKYGCYRKGEAQWYYPGQKYAANTSSGTDGGGGTGQSSGYYATATDGGVGGAVLTQCEYSAYPSAQQPLQPLPSHTHYQQGVIYSPHPDPTPQHDASERKRKLEDNMAASAAKRAINQMPCLS